MISYAKVYTCYLIQLHPAMLVQTFFSVLERSNQKEHLDLFYNLHLNRKFGLKAPVWNFSISTMSFKLLLVTIDC